MNIALDRRAIACIALMLALVITTGACTSSSDDAGAGSGAAATAGTLAGTSGVGGAAATSGMNAAAGIGGMSGGMTGSGGAAGTMVTGNTGGMSGMNGQAGMTTGGMGAGMSAGAGGTVAEPTMACAITSDRVRITEIDLGIAAVNDENEADLHPFAISAMPSGGSRLGFLGNDGAVHIVTLDDGDQVMGDDVTIDAEDFGDLYADDQGGVILATRAAHGAGDKHCGTLTNLCGNASMLPAQYACWDMYMIRFDGSAETWATQLTESAEDHPPYMNSPTEMGDLVYIWEAYAHHARIAFDGESYAGYFGAAISVSQKCVQPDTTLPNAINIHQGDRMQVVSSSGELEPGRGSFDWGCSHSGYERVLWDEAGSRFVSVCKTDNMNRIAVAPHIDTIKPIDLGGANLGDLALGPDGSYWLASSDAQAAGNDSADVMLLRFSIGADAVTLDDEIAIASDAATNERAPHLALYGTDGLLVAWETSSAGGDLRRNDNARVLHLQVRARATGDAIGEAITVPGVLGNRYQELRAFPDGSAAFVAPGADAQHAKIMRVLPCP